MGQAIGMALLNRVSGIVLLLIITPSKVSSFNMDSGEIVYATVEEVIGKTGK